tara:strand:- start:1928 stop:2890 length:963 start_codon:yes stop_codon:yes gene_type:complete
MKNILTFGEPLLINYIKSSSDIDTSDSYFSLGGSEINASITLKKLGNEPYIISSLPNNELGDYYINVLHKHKIKSNFIKRNDELIGSMYVKNKKVFYQRKYSSFSFLSLDDINFNNVFSLEYDWLHLTGITPLLNDNVKEIWCFIIEKAIDIKIPISIDLNYRPSLGSFKELWDVLKKYISDINTLIISENNILNICMLENIAYSSFLDNNLREIANKLNINRIVICMKERDNQKQKRYSVMFYKNIIYYSDIKNHIPLEDIGGGDSYIGCLIDQFLNNPNNILENLDYSDIYTILNQNTCGNFSNIDKKELFSKKNEFR